ncbi:MAG: hypothetical protein LC107_08560 [Chitinophagales bacterium]|nr:hypothetical protein [Chitinophagales bacterium]
MKIAILGWGSLIWDPRNLKFDKDIGWNEKGPLLPIEFSRISKDGRLTLVIDPNAEEIQTLYAISSYESLDESILDLAVREGTGRKSIGCYDKTKDDFSPTSFEFRENIKSWIDTTECDAVIWTNLSEKWETKNDNGDDVTIKPNERISYLRSLVGHKSVLAEEYIRKAPRQINTPIRREIEGKLGWAYIDFC